MRSEIHTLPFSQTHTHTQKNVPCISYPRYWEWTQTLLNVLFLKEDELFISEECRPALILSRSSVLLSVLLLLHWCPIVSALLLNFLVTLKVKSQFSEETCRGKQSSHNKSSPFYQPSLASPQCRLSHCSTDHSMFKHMAQWKTLRDSSNLNNSPINHKCLHRLSTINHYQELLSFPKPLTCQARGWIGTCSVLVELHLK